MQGTSVAPPGGPRLDARIETECFRIAQEALTNVVRHAGARTCTVTLQRDRITVSDDGRGRVATSDGNGLEGLRERARHAGAVVETGPWNAGHASRPGFALTVREDA